MKSIRARIGVALLLGVVALSSSGCLNTVTYVITQATI